MKTSYARDLDAAIREAERFIEAARKAKKLHEADERYWKARLAENGASSKETWELAKASSGVGPARAAANRASMDLTRALAEFRKP